MKVRVLPCDDFNTIQSVYMIELPEWSSQKHRTSKHSKTVTMYEHSTDQPMKLRLSSQRTIRWQHLLNSNKISQH